jgi:hypothetical protein
VARDSLVSHPRYPLIPNRRPCWMMCMRLMYPIQVRYLLLLAEPYFLHLHDVALRLSGSAEVVPARLPNCYKVHNHCPTMYANVNVPRCYRCVDRSKSASVFTHRLWHGNRIEAELGEISIDIP